MEKDKLGGRILNKGRLSNLRGSSWRRLTTKGIGLGQKSTRPPHLIGQPLNITPHIGQLDFAARDQPTSRKNAISEITSNQSMRLTESRTQYSSITGITKTEKSKS